MGGERQPAGLCCSARCFSVGRPRRRIAAAGDGEWVGSASPQGFAVQPAASAAGAPAGESPRREMAKGRGAPARRALLFSPLLQRRALLQKATIA